MINKMIIHLYVFEVVNWFKE